MTLLVSIGKMRCLFSNLPSCSLHLLTPISYNLLYHTHAHFPLSFLLFGVFWAIAELHSILFLKKTTQSLQLSVQSSSRSVNIKIPDSQEEPSMFQSILMKMTPILILLYAIAAFTKVNKILHSRSATVPSLFNYQAISFGSGVYLTSEER